MTPSTALSEAFTFTHWVSIVALVVSLCSLTLSVLGYLRDRHKLKIETTLFTAIDGPGYIEVKAVNVGRRPVFLVMLWGRDERGRGSGFHFDYGGAGIKLSEHEFKIFKVTCLPRNKDEYDVAAMTDEDIIDFKQMSIEDSVGRRYPIPNLAELLPQLRADYKDWCLRTGYWLTPQERERRTKAEAGLPPTTSEMKQPTDKQH